jgi:threonylcarbamoyladenosine tRNA methylthiotransferase MtaB
VKTPWDPALVNTLHQVELQEIGEDGIVRFSYVEEKAVV